MKTAFTRMAIDPLHMFSNCLSASLRSSGLSSMLVLVSLVMLGLSVVNMITIDQRSRRADGIPMYMHVVYVHVCVYVYVYVFMCICMCAYMSV